METLGLIPQFGGLLYTVAAFIAALSVIVAVHEYGHYIVGRWSGIHAEVFSIGFGPVLWSRVDRRGTRWQIAVLPFGGYVKFMGDANAASGKDGETMAEIYRRNPEELRRTMHGAPLWARAATVAAGPIFNFAMSILVFAAIFMARGVPVEPLTVGQTRDLPGIESALLPGDRVVSIAGNPVPAGAEAMDWEGFEARLPLESPLDYVILRDDAELEVPGPHLYPAIVGSVIPRSAAQDAGLQPEDVIMAIDGSPIVAFRQLKETVESSDGKALVLDVWREGQVLQMLLVPRRTDTPTSDGGYETNWRIGVASGQAFDPATTTPGPVEALKTGVQSTYEIVRSSLSGLWHIIVGQISTCNISGPIGIAQASGAVASQGAQSFIAFIAVLSTAVGLLNLFPIPALDGGHLMFYAYEAVAGKPPSDNVLRVLMAIGITLILSLMLFSLSNDLFC
ncbi:RIP metalloprotease RseP [Ruegeria marina]|uniref:Zinc metalloprotease n=1 Tax=Ruegeria marina TaxID=639004 RepID=A0A1G6JCF7_9RHOB|nr:RIP metalloprotease RseP [Ruegeria marina]SDC16418.1 regulator of sigma E protease [Ruegeria marina]